MVGVILNNLLILCAEIAMLVRFSRVSPGRRWICQKVTPVLRGLVKNLERDESQSNV